MSRPAHSPDAPRRTMLLTGASRGIGHATVKRFSSAGWRVITCSRHAFPEDCPWEMGPEDHLQVDLADPASTEEAIAEVRSRLTDGRLDALVNNAGISPKGESGARLGTIETELRDWQQVFQVNFFAPVMLARGLIAETRARPWLRGQRHLDRRIAGSPIRGRGLCHLQGGACGPYAGNGQRFRSAWHPGQRDLTRRDRYRNPVAGHRPDRGTNCPCGGSARRRRLRRRSISCARSSRATCMGPKSTSTAASTYEPGRVPPLSRTADPCCERGGVSGWQGALGRAGEPACRRALLAAGRPGRDGRAPGGCRPARVAGGDRRRSPDRGLQRSCGGDRA